MELRLDCAPEPALVGFSGGADSTALLLLLQAAGWNDLLAVHFNHHLRGADADADQEWCGRFCAARGVSFLPINLYVQKERRRGESVEAAARRCRLEAWRRLVDETGRRIVFLGHHADDALEEFLLRLGRGANASGLTSLREERFFGEGRGGYTICRPLLDFRKTELEAWLRERGVADWRIDATNLEVCCRRNAVRHRLIPLVREIFGTDKGFRQSLRVLRDDAEALENQAAESAAKDSMDLAAWQSLPKALLQRVLRARFPDVAFSGQTVDRIYNYLNINKLSNKLVSLDGGRLMRMGAAGLEVVSLARGKSDTVYWNIRETRDLCWYGNDGSEWEFLAQAEEVPCAGWSESFDAVSLPAELLVRPWRPGDRIRPFGGSGHHRKLQDVFSDAHIPPEARRAWPIVEDGNGELIWVPGLVRAEIGRVGKETSRRLRLSCRRH